MATSNQVGRKYYKVNRMRSDSIGYRAIYFTVFAGFLFVECLVCLALKVVHPFTRLVDRESPIAFAKGAADRSVPHIFQM